MDKSVKDRCPKCGGTVRWNYELDAEQCNTHSRY